MKKYRVVFAGIRHSHIFDLYDAMKKNPLLDVCGVCEEEPEHSLLASRPDIELTDTDFEQMLAEKNPDIIAVGDYYAKRGSLVIRALEAGKHVIADKPLCTSREELDRIEALAAEKGLKVGCMYGLRCPSFMTARELIRSGRLGKITQIQFGGQHPLMRGSRPDWYFEEGKHGGTICDIAVHGIDIIPWLTGLSIKKVLAARTWKAFVNPDDSFNDAAQFMLELDNGCGVLGDVSYSAPDSCGYSMPTYWRFTVWGTEGMIEFNCGNPVVNAYFRNRRGVNNIAPSTNMPEDYLGAFLHDLAGEATELNTAQVLKSMRKTLEIQSMADRLS